MAKKTLLNNQQIKIEWTSKFSDLVKGVSERELANELNKIVLQEILPLIDKGLSPVAGQRTFAKYKNPKKYPGDLKPSNKPNLRLTGEMLQNYRAKAQNRDGLSGTIGIHKDASQRSKLLSRVHNTGENKNIPMRPFIPKQSQGETFTAKITRSIRQAFGYVLSRALNNDKGRGQK